MTGSDNRTGVGSRLLFEGSSGPLDVPDITVTMHEKSGRRASNVYVTT